MKRHSRSRQGDRQVARSIQLGLEVINHRWIRGRGRQGVLATRAEVVGAGHSRRWVRCSSCAVVRRTAAGGCSEFVVKKHRPRRGDRQVPPINGWGRQGVPTARAGVVVPGAAGGSGACCSGGRQRRGFGGSGGSSGSRSPPEQRDHRHRASMDGGSRVPPQGRGSSCWAQPAVVRITAVQAWRGSSHRQRGRRGRECRAGRRAGPPSRCGRSGSTLSARVREVCR